MRHLPPRPSYQPYTKKNRVPRRNFPDQGSPFTTYGFWSVLSGKIAKSSMLVDMVGGCRSGPERCPSVWEVVEDWCVVKVSGEISDVIPSDAHRMARCLCCKWEIAETIDCGKNPDTSGIFMGFRGFERDKPLQTLSTSTALRVGRSVRFLSDYSRHNIRKTTQIEQNSFKKGYKIKQL